MKCLSGVNECEANISFKIKQNHLNVNTTNDKILISWTYVEIMMPLMVKSKNTFCETKLYTDHIDDNMTPY